MGIVKHGEGLLLPEPEEVPAPEEDQDTEARQGPEPVADEPRDD